jgi:hypothetical protein
MNSIVNSILGGDPFGEHDKAPELLAKLNSAHLDGNYFELASEPKSVETLEELKSHTYLSCLSILQSVDSAFPLWCFSFDREALNDDQVDIIEGFVLFDNQILLSYMTKPFRLVTDEPKLFKNSDDFVRYVKFKNE